jgi:hypothetical protein
MGNGPDIMDIGAPVRRLFVIPLRHPIPEMAQQIRPRPFLKRLYDAVYEESRIARSSLDFHRRKSTEAIVESLRPGAVQPLIVKPDGTIIQGNTRIKVLEERGYPVNDLPRETLE